ncbi:hypothetical protein GUITHDRAFT_111920 [Guillardia theta CCMP2712]|uniref:Uncharacterized protein n=1 Tax=Guillardia theta (strain CCMP2712) TaxID=905079 RepID=L1J0L1_GUITC|nr:hypothetical protein GUITHDRAFT_111920 [Guillardia theta CCMP2712]EKX42068.1 hypothetical protein GUITHDRAFT_111920 [Guillardia theta CCMP2712]|eukprot:XP_005829048.1 hypothetical protein GUITHDRAFT_111920 [Guillardia theta CCMP2712]
MKSIMTMPKTSVSNLIFVISFTNLISGFGGAAPTNSLLLAGQGLRRRHVHVNTLPDALHCDLKRLEGCIFLSLRGGGKGKEKGSKKSKQDSKEPDVKKSKSKKDADTKANKQKPQSEPEEDFEPLIDLTCKPPIIRFIANDSDSSQGSELIEDLEDLPPMPEPDGNVTDSAWNTSDSSESTEGSVQGDLADCFPQKQFQKRHPGKTFYEFCKAREIEEEANEVIGHDLNAAGLREGINR